MSKQHTGPAPDAFDLQRIETNGVTLRCAVHGSGPLAILVHGWPESWYSWRHQIEPIANAGFRVVVPDVRGYGGSDAPAEIAAYSMRNLTNDVIGLIDHFGADQAVLVGHDWGAPIVWNTAALHPDRVRGVAALSVPFAPRGPVPPTQMWRTIFADRFFYQTYIQQPGVAEAEIEADVRNGLRRIWFAASGDAPKGEWLKYKPADATLLDDLVDPQPFPSWMSEADIDYYVEQFEHSGLRGPFNRYRAQDGDWHELTELTEARIRPPSAFLYGTKELVLEFLADVDMIANMKRYLDDLRMVRSFEGAGHWLQQERPDEVNGALLEFLSGL